MSILDSLSEWAHSDPPPDRTQFTLIVYTPDEILNELKVVVMFDDYEDYEDLPRAARSEFTKIAFERYKTWKAEKTE